MANKEKRRKLTANQANWMSILMGAIWFIFTLFNGLTTQFTNKDDAIIYWAISCVVGTFCIYIVFTFVFQVHTKETKEIEEKVLQTLSSLLSSDTLTEVFVVYDNSDKEDMFRTILQNEGCKFYAKFIENNMINVIAIDERSTEVYNDNTNLMYFQNHFKLHNN